MLIVGGEGNSAYGCSGGRKEDRCRCFSLRLMWRLVELVSDATGLTTRNCRADGKGEVYVYMPSNEANTKALLAVPPKSYGNFDYGFSVGRGCFNFTRGAWITVAERVRLNDPGVDNGVFPD